MTWCKEIIVDNTHLLDFPPVNKKTEQGWIINYNLNPEAMTADGYSQWTDEQLAAWHAQYDIVTVQDYDDALEAHLLAELTARGYTKRSPVEYTNSSNARWAQDAKEWQAHLDAVMEYGLSVINAYKAGESIPSLTEFKAALPKIQWSIAC